MSIIDRLNYIKMKARHHKEILPWHKKWWGVLIIIILILFIIIAIFSTFYVFNKIKELKLETESKNNEISLENYYKLIKGNDDNYYRGVEKNNTALEPLEITVFSNFSCYYSYLSSLSIKKMIQKFPNELRFVFRDSPTQDSIMLSLGARCAGEQNKFWEMHDFIFDLQDDLIIITEDSKKKEILGEMAETLGLNVEDFNNCLAEKKYIDKIRKDYEDGEALKIKGTPTWFINGIEFTGGLSEENLEALLGFDLVK